MSKNSDKKSTYINLLPLPFRENIDFLPPEYRDEVESGTSFTNRLLRVFEDILTNTDSYTAPDGKSYPSFGRILDIVPEYSYPDTIPRTDLDREFGSWFIERLGLKFTENWSYYQKKQIIKNIIPIYRIRGTRLGLEAFISIYTGYQARVYEILGSYGIGYHRIPINDACGREQNIKPKHHNIIRQTRIGIDTVIGGEMISNLFIINVTIESCRPATRTQIIENLKNQIESEKPVHTFYQLNIMTTMLQVGARGSCTVGVNTIIREHHIIEPPIMNWVSENEATRN